MEWFEAEMNGQVNAADNALQAPSLIRRFLAGEQDVFHELIRPYERIYFRLAFGILHNEHDAEDAVQQAVVILFTRLEQLNDPERFKQWSLRIVQNEAKFLRRKRRQGQYESIDERSDDGRGPMFQGPRDFADWRDLPSEVAEKQEIRNELAKAMESLPPSHREILLLRDVEQLNVAETMEVLGISEAAVKTRLHRARLMLREALAPAFGKSRPSFWERWKGMNPWSPARR
jgi:RNA polymerase sigma-70 factor (ECF subfamily)